MKEEEDLQVELEEQKKQEETLWRQKSSVQWLKEGERARGTQSSSTKKWCISDRKIVSPN
jgi:hypothetical protein